MAFQTQTNAVPREGKVAPVGRVKPPTPARVKPPTPPREKTYVSQNVKPGTTPPATTQPIGPAMPGPPSTPGGVNGPGTGGTPPPNSWTGTPPPAQTQPIGGTFPINPNIPIESIINAPGSGGHSSGGGIPPGTVIGDPQHGNPGAVQQPQPVAQAPLVNPTASTPGAPNATYEQLISETAHWFDPATGQVNSQELVRSTIDQYREQMVALVNRMRGQ